MYFSILTYLKKKQFKYISIRKKNYKITLKNILFRLYSMYYKNSACSIHIKAIICKINQFIMNKT